MKKISVIKPSNNTAAVLYNERFEKYYGKYEELSNATKNNFNEKFEPINVMLEDHSFEWFTEEESYDKTLEGYKKEKLDDLPALESDEEAKEGKE